MVGLSGLYLLVISCRVFVWLLVNRWWLLGIWWWWLIIICIGLGFWVCCMVSIGLLVVVVFVLIIMVFDIVWIWCRWVMLLLLLMNWDCLVIVVICLLRFWFSCFIIWLLDWIGWYRGRNVESRLWVFGVVGCRRCYVLVLLRWILGWLVFGIGKVILLWFIVLRISCQVVL